jgi:hypothetical protein
MVIISRFGTMPLALSDDELAALMDCARPLAPRDRAEFLREAAAELAKHEPFRTGTCCPRLRQAAAPVSRPAHVPQCRLEVRPLTPGP